MVERIKGFFMRTNRFQRFFISGLFWILLALVLYWSLWGSHLYRITAYCNCAICINVPKYQDGRFASGKKTYWGGVAGDPSVRFGSDVELVPFWLEDWKAVLKTLKGRKRFIVEDRGGKIKGKCIDIFIPKSRGGHKLARKWGVRYMRIKINGEFAS